MALYLKVKNLEKYQHYKNRDITSWVKVTCNILDDPDLSRLDDVDRWRWVGIIILATKNHNKIPQNSLWIASRISNSNYKPMSITISNFKKLGWMEVVKMSRPTLEKVYPDLKDLKDLSIKQEGEPSATEVALKEIYKEGFNIYSLMGKMKKKLGWGKDRTFPNEVLLALCKQYHKDKKNIDKPWPWFIKVLSEKSAEYYAQKNIDENKKDGGVPQSMKEIIRGIGK